MFEQATLSNGPAGKKVWTTFLGLTSQAALVSLAALAPLTWPQALPTAHLLESLLPPVPPGPSRPPQKASEPVRRTRVLRTALLPLGMIEPTTIPATIPAFVEEAPLGDRVVGSLPDGGAGKGDIIGNILSGMGSFAVMVERPHEPALTPKAPEPPAAIQRIVEGGNVHLGEPLSKVTPAYPPMARTARVSGDVSLECVVGVDGHIKEVKLVRGNPLLVHAAMDAAWRWVYAPSRLNGVPIEIVTVLTFNFRLN